MHGGLILEVGLFQSPLSNGLMAIRMVLRNVIVLMKMVGCMRKYNYP